MRFNELIRTLEENGFRLLKEKGSIAIIRVFAARHPHLIRVDYHGSKEVSTGTRHAFLKAAGIKRK